MAKAIVVICDGLGDLPVDGRTPLQAAKTPHMDLLAKNGVCGLMYPLEIGVIPGSDTSHLNLFGYDPKMFYSGRGPLEALGAGITLKPGDVAFRFNFATVSGSGAILDRRAGRISTTEAEKLGKELAKIKKVDGVEVIFRHTVEHRGALVLRGKGLSANITDTDPHGQGNVLKCESRDGSNESKYTAEIVNKFMKLAHEKLKKSLINKKRAKEKKPVANAVLLRGAGAFEKVPSIYERYGIKAACIAGGALYKGVARYIGMDVIDVKGATGTKDTDLHAKAQAAALALKNHDLVFLHVKATDSFGHDGDFAGKMHMIEKIDLMVEELLRIEDTVLVVTADHSTPVSLKAHSADPVPLAMMKKGGRVDWIERFDETSCARGSLGRIRGKFLLPLVLAMMGRAKMYGT